MIFSPSDRTLLHYMGSAIAKTFAGWMQSEFWDRRSNRQQAHRKAVASKFRVDRKRASDDFEGAFAAMMERRPR